MVVKTDSERVRLSRKLVLEFLASSVDLSTAPQIQGCMERVRRQARALRPAGAARGRRRARRRAARPSPPPHDGCAATVAQPVKVDNDLYVRDYGEVHPLLQVRRGLRHRRTRTPSRSRVAGRGFDARISTEFAVPLPESACVYCGNCIAVCPTGALMFKSEHDMRAGRHLGRVAPDGDRHDLPLLRRRLHAHAPRAGQRDREGDLAARPRRHPRPPLHQGPVRLAVREPAGVGIQEGNTHSWDSDINPWKLMEAHAAELRALGVRRIGVFGSFAQGRVRRPRVTLMFTSNSPRE